MDPPSLRTPDGRYLIVRDRLWRATNPHLPEVQRQEWLRRLMAARREVGVARRQGDGEALARAGAAVDEAKRALGERGPVWWDDGGPDYNRHLVKNTPYAAWHAREQSRVGGEDFSEEQRKSR